MKAHSAPPNSLLPLLDAANSTTQLENLEMKSWTGVPCSEAGAPATLKAKLTWGCDPTCSLSLLIPYGGSPEAAPTHQTREQRERQETRAKARRYFFIFSSFFPLPGGGTSSP